MKMRMYLVPSRQHEADTREKSCFKHSQKEPQGQELTVRFDQTHCVEFNVNRVETPSYQLMLDLLHTWTIAQMTTINGIHRLGRI